MKCCNIFSLCIQTLTACVASGKRLGSCYRLPFERNMGCYDKVCEFEAVEVRDILLHIQSVHNNGREVVVHDR